MRNNECRMQNEENLRFSILHSAFCVLHSPVMKILTAQHMQNVDRRATDRFAIPLREWGMAA